MPSTSTSGSMPADSGRGPRSRSSHRHQPASASSTKHGSSSSGSKSKSSKQPSSQSRSSKPSPPAPHPEQNPTKHKSLQATPLVARDARIPLKTRTNSAPLVTQASRDQAATSDDLKVSESAEDLPRDSISDDPFFQQYATPRQARITAAMREHAVEDDQDDGEILQVAPSKSTEADYLKKSPMCDPSAIHIGVVGTKQVGKTTFAQCALDLDSSSPVLSRKKSAGDGKIYSVNLFEFGLDELEVGSEKISWPKKKQDLDIPVMDGIVLVYDVMNPDSLPPIRRILTPLQSSSLPVLLVSAKCDKPRLSREIDVDVVEEKAKLLIDAIHLAQVTCDETETHKSCLQNLFQEIIQAKANPEGYARSRSSVKMEEPRKPSPSPQPSLRHVRAISDLSGASLKNATGKDDQKLNDENAYKASNIVISNNKDVSTDTQPRRTKSADAGSHLRIETTLPIPQPAIDATPRSFLNLEESPRLERFQITDPKVSRGRYLPPETPVEPQYYTFDELVAKLLAPPSSKADGKFAVVFLALYRLFASPSRLLDAIITHFDSMARDSVFTITPDQASQDRDLLIIDQWVNAYPGDFAYAGPRRRLRKLIAEVEQNEKLKASVEPISAALDSAVEDDDTKWGCADDEAPFRHRADTFLSTSSIDPVELANNLQRSESVSKIQDMGPEYDAQLIFAGDSTLTLTAMGPDSNSSSQTMLNVAESAQRQAQTLTPNPSIPLTKGSWRALIAAPDNTIATELTRIDWIMFSSIRPRDLIRHVTVPPEERARYQSLENVSRMIDHFNHIAYWVINFILFRDKPKHRVQALEKFMRVARRLRELNNYNSLGAIVAGIQATAVHRLAATKELLSPTVARDWMKLEILMSTGKSHAAYRLAWENSTGGRVPYLPLHRGDLVVAGANNKTFVTASNPPKPLAQNHSKPSNHSHSRSDSASTVASGSTTSNPDDANPSTEAATTPLQRSTTLADSPDPSSPTPTSPTSPPQVAGFPAAMTSGAENKDPRINWPKFHVLGTVLHTIQRAQQTPYQGFAPADDVRMLLLDLQLVRDDDSLYERSVAIEPAGGVGGGIGTGLGAAGAGGAGGGPGGMGTTQAPVEGVRRRLALGLGWGGK